MSARVRYEASDDANQSHTSSNKKNRLFLPLNHHVRLKPPARFRDTLEKKSDQSGRDDTDYRMPEKNDKVVVILQNILRNLENDIEYERTRLKVRLTGHLPEQSGTEYNVQRIW